MDHNGSDPSNGPVGWILAAVASIGSMIAVSWGWVQKQQRQKQAEVGMSYKTLFLELKRDVKLGQEGLRALQEEHVTCRMELATCRTEIAWLKEREKESSERIEELEGEVARLRKPV